MCQTGRVFCVVSFLPLVQRDSGDSEGAPVDRDNVWGGQQKTDCTLPLSCCLCVCSIQANSSLVCGASCLKSQSRFTYMCVCVRVSFLFVFCLRANKHLITIEILHRLLFPFSTVRLCDVCPLPTSPTPLRQLPGAELIAPAELLITFFSKRVTLR